MRTNIKLNLSWSLIAGSAQYISDAEMELMCLKFGSTTGAVEGIADQNDREECVDLIGLRIALRKERQAYLCNYHGSTDGSLDSIKDEDERERAKNDINQEFDRDRQAAEVRLKHARRRAERRKRAEEKAQEEARRAAQMRERIERLDAARAASEAEADTTGVQS